MAKTPRKTRDHYDFRATAGGLVYLCTFVLIGLAAVNTQRALLFVVFGLMVGVFFVSVAVGRRMLSAVDVSRDMPERTFANQVVYLGYHFRARPRRGPAVGLEVGELRPPAPLESIGAYCLHLPAGGHFKGGSRFAASRRGRFALSGMRVSTRFPLSLLRSQRDIPEQSCLVVWPALGEVLVDVLVRGAAEMSDAAPARAQSGSDEFFGLREYRQGDNPRWIHWRRTAATGTPVVREMSRPRPDVLVILLDTHLAAGGSSAGMRGEAPSSVETREKLIRFAATLAEYSFRKDYRVGLALAPNEGVRGPREGPVVLPPAAGRGQRTAVLDALADIDDNTEWPFARLLSNLPQRMLRQAHVVVIGPDASRLGNLAGLRAACRRVTTITPANLDLFFRDASGPDLATADSALPGSRKQEGRRS